MAKNQIKFKQLALDSSEFEGTAAGLIQIKDNAIVEGHILDEAVTKAKLQHIAEDRLLGRISTGTGDVEEVVIEQALTSDSDRIPSSKAVKDAIDANAAGLSWKESVRRASVAPLANETTSGNAGQSDYRLYTTNSANLFTAELDGQEWYEFGPGDRVLIKDESDASDLIHNGIWEVEEDAQFITLELHHDSAFGASDQAQRTALDGQTIEIKFDRVNKVLIFDETSGVDATGTLNASSQVVIQLDGVARTAIMAEVRTAIVSANGFNINDAGSKLGLVSAVVTDGDLRKLTLTGKYSAPGNSGVNQYASSLTSDDIFDNDSENKAGGGVDGFAPGRLVKLMRPSDYPSGSDRFANTAVFVEMGATLADTAWVNTTDEAGGAEIDVTDMTWAQFSGMGSITAGVGLQKAGYATAVVDLHYSREQKDVNVASLGAVGISDDLAAAKALLGSSNSSGAAALQNEAAHMLFLNGVLLQPIAAYATGKDGQDSTDNDAILYGGGGTMTGEYYLFYDASGSGALKAKISSELCVNGDQIVLVAPSMSDDTSL